MYTTVMSSIQSRNYVPKSQRWENKYSWYRYSTQAFRWIATKAKARWTRGHQPKDEPPTKPRRQGSKQTSHDAYTNVRRHRITIKKALSTFQRGIVVNEILSMQATNCAGERMYVNTTTFDTDSSRIGIDNRCSACISHDIKDFDGPVTKVNRSIKGFGGERVMDVYTGTIVWKWQDNDGVTHRFRIPNSYYVPKGRCRLLSPQHWAKTQLGGRYRSAHQVSIGETTYATKSVLFWNGGKNKLDVPHGVNDNVPTFYTSPGFNAYNIFCQQAQIGHDDLVCLEAGIVSDDEDDDDVHPAPPDSTSRRKTFWSQVTGLPIRRQQYEQETRKAQHQPLTTTFNLDGPTTTGRPKPVLVEEEEEKQQTTAAAELLQYHHKYGHISFHKLQKMAKLGILPA